MCPAQFYFQQNSRQQLMAANALKTQGWRFHTQARGRLCGAVCAAARLAGALHCACQRCTDQPPLRLALPAWPQFNAWFARQSQPRMVTAEG